MTSALQQAQDLLVLKHSILLQQLEMKYMQQIDALLTKKTNLMKAIQSSYKQQLADLEAIERTQNDQCRISTTANGDNGVSISNLQQNALSNLSNLNSLSNLNFDEYLTSGLDNNVIGKNLDLNTVNDRDETSPDLAVLASTLINLSQTATQSASNDFAFPDSNELSPISPSEGSTKSVPSITPQTTKHQNGEMTLSNGGALALPQIDVEALNRLVLPNIDELIPPLADSGNITKTAPRDTNDLRENGEIDQSRNSKPRNLLNHNHNKVEYRPPPTFNTSSLTASASTISSTTSSSAMTANTSNVIIPNGGGGVDGRNQTQSTKKESADWKAVTNYWMNRNRKRPRAVMEDEVSSGSEDSGGLGVDLRDDTDLESDWSTKEKKIKSRRERKKAKRSSGDKKGCCICNRPPSSKMIKCANVACKVRDFHVSCMRLFKGTPTLKWYCKSCRRYPSKSNIIKPEWKRVNGL